MGKNFYAGVLDGIRTFNDIDMQRQRMAIAQRESDRVEKQFQDAEALKAGLKEIGAQEEAQLAVAAAGRNPDETIAQQQEIAKQAGATQEQLDGISEAWKPAGKGLRYKSDPKINFEFSKRRAALYSSMGDHKTAGAVLQQATQEVAGHFYNAFVKKDKDTVLDLYNQFPNQHDAIDISWDGKGNVLVTDKDGVKTIPESDIRKSVIGLMSPKDAEMIWQREEASAERYAAQLERNSILSGNQQLRQQNNELGHAIKLLQLEMRGGGRAGSSSSGNGDGGSGKATQETPGTLKHDEAVSKFIGDFIDKDGGLKVYKLDDNGNKVPLEMPVPQAEAKQQASMLFAGIARANSDSDGKQLIGNNEVADIALKATRVANGDKSFKQVKNAGGELVNPYELRVTHDKNGMPSIVMATEHGSDVRIDADPSIYRNLVKPEAVMRANVSFANRMVDSGESVALMQALDNAPELKKRIVQQLAVGNNSNVDMIGQQMKVANLSGRLKALYGVGVFKDIRLDGTLGDMRKNMIPYIKQSANAPITGGGSSSHDSKPASRNKDAVDAGQRYGAALKQVGGMAMDVVNTAKENTIANHPVIRAGKAIRPLVSDTADFVHGVMNTDEENK